MEIFFTNKITTASYRHILISFKILGILFFCVILQSCQEKKFVSPEQARKQFITSYEKHMKKLSPSFELLHDISSSKERGFVGIKAMVRGEYQKKEALALFSMFTHDFLSFAATHPTTHHFFPKKLQNPQQCEIVLTFWTEDMDRPSPEYASEIQLKEGSVFYLHKEVGSEFLDLNDKTCVAFDELD